MIEGVKVVPLRKIPDERGAIYHMLRVDSDHFTEFGEIYFSYIYPNAIKAWHKHKLNTLNYSENKAVEEVLNLFKKNQIDNETEKERVENFLSKTFKNENELINM